MAQPSAKAAHDELTELEAALLEFEELHPAHSLAKADALRDRFGMSPARYYQTLGILIESSAALRAHPLLVGRLRRTRDERRLRRRGDGSRATQ